MIKDNWFARQKIGGFILLTLDSADTTMRLMAVGDI
jgi:hypothetical protein